MSENKKNIDLQSLNNHLDNDSKEETNMQDIINSMKEIACE